MRSFRLKIEMIVTEENSDLALDFVRKKLGPTVKIVSHTHPCEVVQVWVDKKEER